MLSHMSEGGPVQAESFIFPASLVSLSQQETCHCWATILAQPGPTSPSVHPTCTQMGAQEPSHSLSV